MVEKYAIADYVTRKVLHQQVSLEAIETWSTHIIILVVPGIFTGSNIVCKSKSSWSQYLRDLKVGKFNYEIKLAMILKQNGKDDWKPLEKPETIKTGCYGKKMLTHLRDLWTKKKNSKICFVGWWIWYNQQFNLFAHTDDFKIGLQRLKCYGSINVPLVTTWGHSSRTLHFLDISLPFTQFFTCIWNLYCKKSSNLLDYT